MSVIPTSKGKNISRWYR